MKQNTPEAVDSDVPNDHTAAIAARDLHRSRIRDKRAHKAAERAERVQPCTCLRGGPPDRWHARECARCHKESKV